MAYLDITDNIEDFYAYCYHVFKSATWLSNADELMSNWKNVLELQMQVNGLITNPNSDDQVFCQDISFGDFHTQFFFDISKLKLLSNKHLHPQYKPLKEFAIMGNNILGKKIIYQKESIDTDNPQAPILVVPFSINPSIFGFVTDGNHRVNQRISMNEKDILTYMCSEQMAYISLITFFQRALYELIQEIEEIRMLNLERLGYYQSHRIQLFK